MILPLYLFFVFFPGLWAMALVGNFIIDSILLIVIGFVVFKRFNGGFYKSAIIKAWLLGFASDFIGVAGLFIARLAVNPDYHAEKTVWDSIHNGLYYSLYLGNSFYNPWSFLCTFGGIIIAATAIFLFDYFITFSKTELSKRQRIFSALAFAVFTAPYTFLIPIE